MTSGVGHHAPWRWRTAVLVAAGGALGATLRWATGLPFDTAPGDLPWHTLGINLVGSLLIGVASRRLVPHSPPWLFAVSGCLGGFTTMSLLAVELNDLVDAGHRGIALGYLAATLVGGTAAVLAGERGHRPTLDEGEP